MKALRARSLTVGALACALALAGCTSGDGAGAAATTTASATPDASGSTGTAGPSASGDEVLGRSRAYTVVPPEGWAEATDRAEGVAGVDLVLLSSRKVDGFANNLVVLGLDGGEETLHAELDRGRAQMEAAGRTVSDAPDRTVGGAPASGFTTVFEQQGITIVSRTWAVVHAGRVFLLTLSASRRDADHALTELDEILSSWTWT
jgi:hypothetical protein